MVHSSLDKPTKTLVTRPRMGTRMHAACKVGLGSLPRQPRHAGLSLGLGLGHPSLVPLAQVLPNLMLQGADTLQTAAALRPGTISCLRGMTSTRACDGDALGRTDGTMLRVSWA